MEHGIHDHRGYEHRRRVACDRRHEVAACADRSRRGSSAGAARPARCSRMKIAVVGAGAIGGYLGGWLAAAGEEVTFVARGANLDAIRQRGMRVVGEDGSEVSATTVRAVEIGRAHV